MTRRGAFVIAVPGEYGKPRPALVVQSDLFADFPSLVVCPLTTMLRNDVGLFRIDVVPSAGNGIRQASQVAIDKVTVVPIGKVGQVIGHADQPLVIEVDRALALFLGLV